MCDAEDYIINTSEIKQLSFIKHPPHVGYWKLDGEYDGAGGLWIAIRKKPTDQQIKNTEEAFGWKWIDAWVKSF